LAVINNLDGTALVNVTGTAPLSFNEIYKAQWNGQYQEYPTWTEVGSISGDGSIIVPGLGSYLWRLDTDGSFNSLFYQTVSNPNSTDQSCGRENWERWLVASINVFFDAQAESWQYPFHSENQYNQERVDSLILRVTGPTILETTKNKFKLVLTINILVKANRDDNDDYKIYRMVGAVQKMFRPCIPTYRLGDGICDDGSFLGHLELISEKNSDIRTENFGQVTPDVPLLQSTVEGRYQILLSDN